MIYIQDQVLTRIQMDNVTLAIMWMEKDMERAVSVGLLVRSTLETLWMTS